MPRGHFTVEEEAVEGEDVDDGLLDMRYNMELDADYATAADILNNASNFELG